MQVALVALATNPSYHKELLSTVKSWPRSVYSALPVISAIEPQLNTSSMTDALKEVSIVSQVKLEIYWHVQSQSCFILSFIRRWQSCMWLMDSTRKPSPYMLMYVCANTVINFFKLFYPDSSVDSPLKCSFPYFNPASQTRSVRLHWEIQLAWGDSWKGIQGFIFLDSLRPTESTT